MKYSMQLRKSGRAASLLAMAVMLFLLGSQIAQAASWQVVTSPSPGTYNSLNAVAAVSANDVWAVGNASTGSTLTLIENWNGASWQVVSSPNPGTTDNSLNGVAAINATNVWTVGLSQNGSSPSQTLIEHYNGTSWQVVASPNVGTSYNQLDGVAALSASNIWAVGFYRNSSDTNQTLIEHYNGTSWQVVTSPNLGTAQNSLYAVAAVRARNIWAVGNYTNNSGNNQTLIEHWNGTSWTIVPSPNSGTSPNNLWGVAAVSAANIWTVGSSGAPASPPTQTLIEHWNGKHWKIVASPNPGSAHNSLSSVTAVSATNIWAVGAYENSNDPGQTLIENWNGTSWQVVASPNVGTSDNGLSGVAAVSASNLWAIGGYAITMGPIMTLTEEYS